MIDSKRLGEIKTKAQTCRIIINISNVKARPELDELVRHDVDDLCAALEEAWAKIEKFEATCGALTGEPAFDTLEKLRAHFEEKP